MNTKQRNVIIAGIVGLLVIPLLASAIVVKHQCRDTLLARVLGVNKSCGLSGMAPNGKASFIDASGREVNLDLSEIADYVATQKAGGVSQFSLSGDGSKLSVKGEDGKSFSLDLSKLGVMTDENGNPLKDAEAGVRIDGTTMTLANGATVDLAPMLGLADYYQGTGITISGSRVIAATLGTSISTAEVEDSAITTSKVADQNVTTGKLADEAVVTSKLAQQSVTTSKLADENVTTEKLAEESVTNIKISNSAITTDKIADGTILFEDLNDNDCQGGQVIKYSGSNWTCGTGITPGDIKSSMQTADHGGWVKLDGRSISSLTAEQQIAAGALGFSGSLPNADSSFLVQNGTALGSVSGSNDRTIARNQLPNFTLGGNTSVNGSHSHSYTDPTNGNWSVWPVQGVDHPPATQYPTTNGSSTAPAGDHSHTITTDSINGNVTQQQLNITPRSLSVNMFIYLGL